MYEKAAESKETRGFGFVTHPSLAFKLRFIDMMSPSHSAHIPTVVTYDYQPITHTLVIFSIRKGAPKVEL